MKFPRIKLGIADKTLHLLILISQILNPLDSLFFFQPKLASLWQSNTAILPASLERLKSLNP